MYRYICIDTYVGFQKWGYPKIGWFIEKFLSKWMIWWGYHHLGTPHICIYIYIISGMSIDGILEGNNCGRHQWDRFSTSVMNIHGVLVGN